MIWSVYEDKIMFILPSFAHGGFNTTDVIWNEGLVAAGTSRFALGNSYVVGENLGMF